MGLALGEIGAGARDGAGCAEVAGADKYGDRTGRRDGDRTGDSEREENVSGEGVRGGNNGAGVWGGISWA